MDLAAAWRKACNGSHKVQEEQCAVREVATARREACNGEMNNVPTLKMEKWNGDATMFWVVGKWENNSR